MEYNGYEIIRNDIRNFNDTMSNDNFEAAINKNFGIFPKRNIINIFMKARNNM